MALIKCQECGKDYSENADKCPKCGNPTPDFQQKIIAEVNTKADKGFWVTGRLVIGLISINLFIAVTLYSCFAFGAFLSSNEDKIGFAGFSLAVCLLNAGIIGICTRNCKSKIGAIVTTVFYWIGTLSAYDALPELAVMLFIFGSIFLVCAIKTKTIHKQSKKKRI